MTELTRRQRRVIDIYSNREGSDTDNAETINDLMRLDVHPDAPLLRIALAYAISKGIDGPWTDRLATDSWLSYFYSFEDEFNVLEPMTGHERAVWLLREMTRSEGRDDLLRDVEEICTAYELPVNLQVLTWRSIAESLLRKLGENV